MVETTGYGLRPRRGRNLWLGLLLLLLATTVLAQANDTDVTDRYYDDWLSGVEHLMLDAEYEAFLDLDDGSHRELFIRRFWAARSSDERGWRNAALEGWRRNFEETLGQYGSLASDRARAMLIAGRPDRVLPLRRCAGPVRDLEIWSFSPWQIERQTRRRETEGFDLVFYLDGDEASGYFFRHWSRDAGPEALVWPQGDAGEEPEDEGETTGEAKTEDDPWTVEKLLEFAGAKNCFDFDPQAALTVEAALRDALTASELIGRISPPVPDPVWLAELAAEIETGRVEPLSGSAKILFPASYDDKTLVAGQIDIPTHLIRRTERGFLFDRLVLTGDVWQEGHLVDDFRVEHHISGRAPPREALSLSFHRLLAPGRYTFSLRAEDAEGFGLARVVREVEVPHFESSAAQPTGDLADRTRRNVATATTLASVELLPPGGPTGGGSPDRGVSGTHPVAGKAEVRAVTTGDVARVDFLLDGEPATSVAEPPFTAEIRFGRLPRRRALRAVAFDDESREVASDEIVVNGGPHRFAVRLVEPVRGAGGATAQRAHAIVDLPEGETLDRVELFLGDERLATLYRPPYFHPLPDPIPPQTAFVHAVATLANGEAVEDLAFLDAIGPVDEIDVRLVELYTSVLDPQGRFIPGKGAGDFRVLEDGEPQPITRFATLDQLPIHVALLLDISGSMKQRLDIATESALRFFDTVIDPAKDQAALLTFHHDVRLRVPFTHDVERLRYGVSGLAAWQSTRLHDAIIHAGHYFGGLQGKRALIVLSDGEDIGSTYLFKHVLEHTLRAGVAVYPIAIDLVDPLTRQRLARLATETGGTFFSVDRVEQTEEVYRRLEAELRSQYLLVYPAPDARRQTFRTVEVQVTGPTTEQPLRAKTIHGYYP
ncbi:MAG: VWA domain-containing protein [Acidobacteriota bacterium]